MVFEVLELQAGLVVALHGQNSPSCERPCHFEVALEPLLDARVARPLERLASRRFFALLLLHQVH
jgi:hypothetical protein